MQGKNTRSYNSEVSAYFFPFCLAWTAYVGAIAWLRNGIRFEGKNGAGWLFCGLDYTAR